MSTPPQDPGSQEPPSGGNPPAGQKPYGPGQFPEISPGVPRYGQYAPEGFIPPSQQAPAEQTVPQYRPFPPAEPMPKPPLVQRAFIMIMGAGLLQLVSLVVSFFQIPELRSILQQTAAQFPEMTDSIVTAALVLSLVFNALFVALYVLIAVKIRAGRNWARIVGTVLAGLSLLLLFSGPFAIVQVALGVFGIVYCWLAPSRDYFRRL